MFICPRCKATDPKRCKCIAIDRAVQEYEESTSEEQKAKDTERFISDNPIYIEMGIQALEIVANHRPKDEQ